MTSKAFDYSKWDNIELSDDESDLHPNIDKDSWFRLKHRTRIEREQREDQEILEIEQKNKEDQARVNVIKSRLTRVTKLSDQSLSNDEAEDAAFEDTEALLIEQEELQQQIDKRNKRIAEIKSKRQWNIDNICKVTEEKTIINSVQSKPLKADVTADTDIADIDSDVVEEIAEVSKAADLPKPVSDKTAQSVTPPVPPSDKNTSSEKTTTTTTSSSTTSTSVSKPTTVAKGVEPAATIKRERMAVISYNDFAIKHEKILETYSDIEDLEKTKDFLFRNCDILLHEHAQSYMLLSSLEDEMNGKHKRMKLVCRQSQILTHIHELGVSMRRDPRDVILPFFKRIEEAQYLTGFLQAVDDFVGKIQKRAVEKKKEMQLERQQRKSAGNNDEGDDEDEEVEYETVEGAAVGPGGLNPLEVLKKLPKPMRKAFESQDIGRLQEVLAQMNPEEAKHWMKQCVDSGLWVANDSSAF